MLQLLVPNPRHVAQLVDAVRNADKTLQAVTAAGPNARKQSA